MKNFCRYTPILIIILFIFILRPASAQDAADYAKTIENADSYFAKGDYINAKASYQYALQLKPEEQYPKDKLQETLGLIKNQQEKSNLYAAKVMVADEYYKKKDYISALRFYKDALTFLPSDKYANDKVAEINMMMEQSRLNEAKYNSSLAEGEKLLQSKEYQKALDQFLIASDLKPEEAYPRDRIAEAKSLIADQKAMADDYSKALQAAESFMVRAKYEEAILEYEKALALKPGTKEVMSALDQAKALKIESDAYAQLVQEGDNFYIEKRFAEAKGSYLQASAMRPDDEYPKRMIEKVDIAMQDISEAKQSDYEIAIARADRYYNQKDYDNAIAEYNNALRFKPDGEYARKRIEDISNDMMMRQMADDAYNQSISKGDNLFKEKKYEEALYEFGNALKYKPLEKYPKVKIDEIETILAELKDQREIYNSIVQGADKLFFADDYADARIQYRKAQALFPDEQYPKDQIVMINEILGERDVNIKVVTDANNLFELKEPSPEELAKRDFQLKMDLGNELYMEGKFDEALVAYQQALEIMPKDSLSLEKIAATETRLEEQKAQEALDLQFAEAIQEGDGLFEAGDLDKAMAAYQAAATLKPEETQAREKMDAVLEKKEAIAAQQLIDKQYAEALATADNLYQSGDLANALLAYQVAAGIKPAESKHQEKINEINTTMEAIAAKKAVDQQYAEAMNQADAYFQAGDYTQAMSAYQSAAALKPGESQPQEKIAEVTASMDALAAQQALEQQYNDAISKAEDYYKSADYASALTAYQAAANLKPGENLPKERIAEINSTMEALAAQQALDQQYAEALSKADNFYQAGDYANAMVAYQSASALKPGESAPQEKIAEIDATLDALAAQQALDQQYAEALSKADNFYQAGDWTNARASYQAAAALKPGESRPKEQISEINATMDAIAAQQAMDQQYADAIATAESYYQAGDLANAMTAYQSAAALKPGESQPQEKITEINAALDAIAAQKALDQQYTDAITRANDYYQAGDLSSALAAYQSAAKLKPAENQPQERINEITSTLDAIAAQQALDQQYSDIITNADKLLASEDYAGAMAAYQQAMDLKPAEEYPRSQINIIVKTTEEIARQQEIEKQYAEAVKFGDKNFAEGNYAEARNEYQTANSLIPSDQYPLDKIAEIEAIILEQERQKELEANYSKAISIADESFKSDDFNQAILSLNEALELKPGDEYAAAKLAEVKQTLQTREAERQDLYDMAILNADNYLGQENYEMAKLEYERASDLIPEEVYPLDQLKQVNELLLRKKQVVQEAYDKAVADADKFYAGKIYDNAIESYRAAGDLKPNEEYPKEMVKRILKLISERAIVQINKDPILIKDNTERKFTFIPVPVKDRKSNYIFFKAVSKTTDAFKVIISFGAGGAKNGGMVIKIPKGADLNDFIVRISAQYKWFSEENDWITFYPEGGDIEVSLVQISYSD